MSKFARTATVAAPRMPQSVTGRTVTYEGAPAFTVDDRTALFTLAVTNMVNETTFYESARKRDARYVDLIHRVAASDPDWLRGFLPWLRTEGKMRTASVVGAVEFARAGGGPSAIADVLARGDEPAEALGYHFATYGRSLPAAVKRGIARSATKLYGDRAVLRYDSAGADIRMADVIELTHPKPKADWQSNLFRHLIDRRHGRGDAEGTTRLLGQANALEQMPMDQRRAHMRAHGIPEGMSLERFTGWIPGGMDAEAWEAILPEIGYGALLKNLRNLEQAGISAEAMAAVAARIADPEQVKLSRLFPYRFMSAWTATGSMTFGPALEAATNAACSNIPRFAGRTLVLVDVSGSMTWGTVAAKSKVRPIDAASLFGAALAQRCDSLDLIAFGTTNAVVKPLPSVLRTQQELVAVAQRLGGGTNMLPAIQRWFAGHDRLIVLTDNQCMQSTRFPAPNWPDVPTYVWDLDGYGRTTVNLDAPGKYLFGGFSDAAFSVVGLLERGAQGRWPWQES